MDFWCGFSVSGTYTIAQPGLKDGPVLARPSLGNPRVVGAQLNQIAEDGDAWNLGQTLDFRNVGSIEVSDQEVDGGDDAKRNDGVRHGFPGFAILGPAISRINRWALVIRREEQEKSLRKLDESPKELVVFRGAFKTLVMGNVDAQKVVSPHAISTRWM